MCIVPLREIVAETITSLHKNIVSKDFHENRVAVDFLDWRIKLNRRDRTRVFSDDNIQQWMCLTLSLRSEKSIIWLRTQLWITYTSLQSKELDLDKKNIKIQLIYGALKSLMIKQSILTNEKCSTVRMIILASGEHNQDLINSQ